jgi:hypothetical protein
MSRTMGRSSGLNRPRGQDDTEADSESCSQKRDQLQVALLKIATKFGISALDRPRVETTISDEVTRFCDS